MLVLDANHVRELEYPSATGVLLRSRLQRASEEVFTTVVTVEEELRGLLARANRVRDADEIILAYERLMEHVNLTPRAF